MDKKIKLFFCDMEGTIFKKAVSPRRTSVPPSAWFLIAEELGPRALEEERRTQRKWNNGEYANYLQWMEDTIRIHKKYGLTKKVFQDAIDKIELMNGVKEVFKILNRAKIPTCLISGGFKYQADKAACELKIRHAFSGCEYFWDKKGHLDHWILSPSDVEGKVALMKLMIEEYKYGREECAFVGDGDNDVYLAREVGISIAFNGSARLSKCATYSIVQKPTEENFLAILDYLKLSA